MRHTRGSGLAVPGALFCLAVIALMIIVPPTKLPVRETMTDAYVVQQTMKHLKPNLEAEQKRAKDLGKKVMDIVHSNAKHKTGHVKGKIDEVMQSGRKP